MLRGLYTAASALIANQRRHDAVTNNIANLNTPGYKANVAVKRSFPEMLIALTNAQSPRSPSGVVGRMHTGVFIEETLPIFLQGDLLETRDLSDFAIVSHIEVEGLAFDASGKAVTEDGRVVFRPQAMFVVRTGENEERYTRNGKFTVDAAGNLVTSDGHLVLDTERRPIRLDRPITEVSVSSRGQFFDGITGEPLLDEAGNPIALLIARIENPNRLIREGNGNFRLPEGDEPPGPVNPEDNAQVHQGFVERSNVDPIQSVTEMMAALRAYEANQRIVQFYDRTLEKAVTEVGRV